MSQPASYAAIELIHKQPVRWTHDRVVACDGGGGPAGHPRIFINTDKPEIAVCNYCGSPFVRQFLSEHFSQEDNKLTRGGLGQRAPQSAPRVAATDIIPAGGRRGSGCNSTSVEAAPSPLEC